MQYNLCDIHFHTNLSFDAYENNNGNSLQYDIDDIIENYINQSLDEINRVKLICMTDHNIFNYNNYLQQKLKFGLKGIYLLPGIEVKGNDKIHWVIIFNDLILEKDKKGQKLEEFVKEFYNYNDSEDILIQTERIQNDNIDILDFIRKILDLKIEFLAIPHMDKSNGWHNVLKKFPEQNKLLNYLICDGIVNGFESKKMENSILEKIKNTCEYLGIHYDELNNLNSQLLDLEKLDSSSDEYVELNDEINKKNTQILNEEKYLKIVSELQNIIDENEVPNIYGSDFHGKNDEIYPIDNLFYIKSECSFEGLKFALLDCESRIFSKQRYSKYDKSNNYVITKINLKINDENIVLNLGDGLNSIIGSRGTGKTFLLYKLLNLKGYSGSTIEKQITLENIEFSSHSPSRFLNENNYTYIGQKSNVNSKDKDNKNIYDLLAEAPYDYKKFEESLKRIYKKTSSNVSEKPIEEMLQICNNLIDNYILLEEERNQKYDFSFIKDYNDFYSGTNDDIIIYGLFEKIKYEISKENNEITKKINKIEETIKSLDGFKNNLIEIFQYQESRDILKDNLIFKDNFESLDELKVLLENIEMPFLEKKKNENIGIEEVNNRILTNLSKQASNSQNILSDYIKNLTKNISSTIEILNDIHKDEKYINDRIARPIINIDQYMFESTSSRLELLLKKEISFDNLSNEIMNQLFENYKSFSRSSDLIKKIFELNKYGVTFVKEVYPFRDQRRSSCHLVMPDVDPEVLLKKDDNDYVRWDEQSPGQRSDIILSFVLEGNTSKILIIDQPEDDLDNETIFNKIVQLIRKIKHNRQIIIVTHNANLAINGDSDKLIICQNDNNNFNIICDSLESNNHYDYKSLNSTIENQTALKIGCEILEGGIKALKQRVNKIGYRQLFFKGE